MKIKEYREVINAFIEKATERGYKGKLSEAMGVHSSYLTRVLSGEAHITPDQAAELARFWKLSEKDAKFFLLLVLRERAGSKTLIASLDRDIESLLESDKSLSMNIRSVSGASTLYYSTWYYSAIHVLLLNPELRTEKALASVLRLDRATLKIAIAELEALGLVKASVDGGWISVARDVHLAEQAHETAIFHAAWRQKAAVHLGERRLGELHYSGMHVCSAEDRDRVREILAKAILECRKIAAESPGEEAQFALLADFFAL